MVRLLSLSSAGKKMSFSLTAIFLLIFSITVNGQCSSNAWKQLSQGQNFSIALKNDGTIWMWGLNDSGVRGNGSSTVNAVIKHPEQIETDSDWKDISTGHHYVIALKENGDLYGWGQGAYGNFGQGSNTNFYTPTKIATGVKAYAAGYYSTLIVKTDGTLWATGYNDWGNLGLGTSEEWVNTFKQVGTATNWEKVFSGWYNSFAIKTDGTLWSCGSHNYGVTGQGTTAGEVDLFTQVGTATNWSSISVSPFHVLGLTTGGKLYSWGVSSYGRLGIVSPSNAIYYTPQAIDASSTYSAITTGYDNSMVKRADGAIFAGGNNSYGKLGIGVDDASTEALAFVRIGTATNWKSLPMRMGEVNTGVIDNSSQMYVAGADNFNQLGNSDGTSTNSNSLTQVTCADALGVNDIASQNKVALYPNPARDYVLLQSSKAISEVKIYNTAGAIVKSISKVSDNKINVADLSAGVYIVTINDVAEGIKLIKK
ncbi:MAG: hypothetical protein DI529_08845 [Chryseobacterium sp.]|nr:MAG: hypothetical protein DI529_08845 [Chryseobacterium sp.]